MPPPWLSGRCFPVLPLLPLLPLLPWLSGTGRVPLGRELRLPVLVPPPPPLAAQLELLLLLLLPLQLLPFWRLLAPLLCGGGGDPPGVGAREGARGNPWGVRGGAAAACVPEPGVGAAAAPSPARGV